MRVEAIVTVPPYAPFLGELAAHPRVCGLRLNTVMPLAEPREAVLARLAALGSPLWVDLKARQLRVVEAATPPYTALRLSHRIRVRTPTSAWLSAGRERLEVRAVDGDRLILADGPRRLVGPGESVNIPDPSLEVEGLLTESDRAYLEAMRRLGLSRVMLSYAESPDDLEAVRAVLPGAEVMLKIESRRGLDLARAWGSRLGRLLAARGDLYVELPRPHRILAALADIVAADPKAVVGSRLFESLLDHPVPASAEIGDVAFLLGLGYRTVLLGDALCFDREAVLAALELLGAIARER